MVERTWVKYKKYEVQFNNDRVKLEFDGIGLISIGVPLAMKKQIDQKKPWFKRSYKVRMVNNKLKNENLEW